MTTITLVVGVMFVASGWIARESRSQDPAAQTPERAVGDTDSSTPADPGENLEAYISQQREAYMRLSVKRATEQLDRMDATEMERAVRNLEAEIAMDAALHALQEVVAKFPDTPAGQKAAMGLMNFPQSNGAGAAGVSGGGFF